MTNDWTGNNTSVFATLGASSHSETERESNDFYATDPMAVDALLDYDGHILPRKVWEPSCGTGELSTRLSQHGFEVISTDLIDRGFGRGGVNFFEQMAMPEGCTAIITNPPYKYATEYVTHALSLLPDNGTLALFLKTTFAEGQQRYREIFSRTPPRYILQCVQRINCAKNADFHNAPSSAVSYAWWIWVKNHRGPTTLDWINHN